MDTSILNMSDADFLNVQMPSAEAASSHQESEENKEETTQQETTEENTESTSEETNTEADTQEDASEETTSEETQSEENTETNEVDTQYKAQLDKLFAPFKANGKEIKVDSVDEAITLMQQGANYNKKMAALKPSLKILKMLENNGLLDEGKLTYLIDIDKKNPEAINKLIQESGINPLDVNTEEAPKYTPGNYSVSDAQVNLDSVLDSIEHTPTYERTMTVILDEWDEGSKRALANEPSLIPLINQHMSNGIFDIIANEMVKQKALGTLSGLSDLQAYERVGQQLASNGAFNKATPEPVAVEAKVPTQANADLAAKRKAASPSKTTTPAKTNDDFNPLNMSDEEFEKAFNTKFR